MQWQIPSLRDVEFDGRFQQKFTNRTQFFWSAVKINVNDSHRKNCTIFVAFF